MSISFKFYIGFQPFQPDQGLFRSIEKCLTEHDHQVFTCPPPAPSKQSTSPRKTPSLFGMENILEIEKQIKSSDCFIILISKHSIQSEWTRYELNFACELRKKRGDKFKILPVFVHFNAEIPYDLKTNLTPFPFTRWASNTDTRTVCAQLIETIENNVPLPFITSEKPPQESDLLELFNITEAAGVPLPSADHRLFPQLDTEAGIIKFDSPFYIKRKIDVELLQQITLTGSTTILKGLPQTGKTSLLARTHAKAKTFQHNTLYIDFQSLDSNHLNSIDSLARYLSQNFHSQFKTGIDPIECWDHQSDPQTNLTQYLKKEILDKSENQVILILDEIDRVFHFRCRDEFSRILRHWHDLRETEASWKRLNMVFVLSTEPAFWLQDIEHSPFPVGHVLTVEDFNLSQVESLNTLYHKPLKNDEQVQELYDWLSGHPYLVRSAFYMISGCGWDFSKLKESAADEPGIFGDHFRYLVSRVITDESLKRSLVQVLNENTCEFDTHFLRLRSMGLITGETRTDARIRCKLYEDYFRRLLKDFKSDNSVSV